jgi:two-component system, OmpR family, response regulator
MVVAVMRVLVVDRDLIIAQRLRRHLVRGGMVVDVATSGADAWCRTQSGDYDAAVLDIGTPDLDGREACRRLRAADVTTPVLLLGRCAAATECVSALDSGADDYVRKPFDVEEVGARLRALVRRGPVLSHAALQMGDLHVDLGRRRVSRGASVIGLSAKELALLAEFLRHPGLVLSRYHLLEHVWDGEYENRSNIVDVYVRYLRLKIDRPFGKDSIETVRGAGYRLRDTRARPSAARVEDAA